MQTPPPTGHFDLGRKGGGGVLPPFHLQYKVLRTPLTIIDILKYKHTHGQTSYLLYYGILCIPLIKQD